MLPTVHVQWIPWKNTPSSFVISSCFTALGWPILNRVGILDTPHRIPWFSIALTNVCNFNVVSKSGHVFTATFWTHTYIFFLINITALCFNENWESYTFHTKFEHSLFLKTTLKFTKNNILIYPDKLKKTYIFSLNCPWLDFVAVSCLQICLYLQPTKLSVNLPQYWEIVFSGKYRKYKLVLYFNSSQPFNQHSFM